MALPGDAVMGVACTLWYEWGMRRRPKTFQFKRHKIPFSRQALWRGLHSLEDAGLIAVKRKRGALPTITLLEVQQ
jgi:hypothetical protein